MLNSIRERHGASMDLHIQIGKRAANLACPSLKRVKKDVRVLWNEQLALPSRQWQLINLTIAAHTLPAFDQAHNVNHLPRALQRTCKIHAMPTFHDLRPTYPSTQDKTILPERRHS